MSDLNTLQTLLSDAETQLANIFAEKSSVLGLLSALDATTPASPDVVSKSKSGEAGSTSFTYVSLTSRLEALVRSESAILANIKELKWLVAASGPGLIRGCNPGGW